MDNIADIQAPHEPNAADTFESLRLVAQRHVARASTGAAQRGGHSDLLAAIARVLEPAREAVATLENAPLPTTPAGAETRARELAGCRDLARAYGELMSALTNACGATCAHLTSR